MSWGPHSWNADGWFAPSGEGDRFAGLAISTDMPSLALNSSDFTKLSWPYLNPATCSRMHETHQDNPNYQECPACIRTRKVEEQKQNEAKKNPFLLEEKVWRREECYLSADHRYLMYKTLDILEKVELPNSTEISHLPADFPAISNATADIQVRV